MTSFYPRLIAGIGKITRRLQAASAMLGSRSKIKQDTSSHGAGRSPSSGSQNAAHADRCRALVKKHHFSIVIPAYRTPSGVLQATLRSILDQALPAYEVIIVDDSGSGQSVRPAIVGVADPFARVRVISNPTNIGISSSTNIGVANATGDFIFFVDHDDELTVDALLQFAESIEREPDKDVWYSDQCTIDEHGALQHHFLKPDWSPVYAMGAMYVGHLLAVRAEICRKVPFRSEHDGVQDFDFVLRVSEMTSRIGHVRTVAYKWRSIEGSLARGGDEKSGIDALQRRVVNEHLARTGRTWRADNHPTLPHRLKLTPSRRSAEPRISIVIPSRNQGDILARCLESLYTLTDYDDYEVIVVDNRSTDPKAVAQFSYYPLNHVRYREKTFNYSRANNMGVAEATGDLIVLLNNDTEVIDSDWLRNMSMYFEDAEIGAVGATLLYPDRTVQHAGVILGPRGTADHIMRNFAEDADGYGGSLAVARETSAVTGACLMMRRSLFASLGGLSTDYAKHYQDVDLCLRIRERGLRILSLGSTRLIHHESLSRKNDGYDHGDRAILLDRWRKWIVADDPYYNPGFVRGSVNYELKPSWLS